MEISKLVLRITPADLDALGNIIMGKVAPVLQKLPKAVRELHDLQLRFDGENLEIGISLPKPLPLIPETELCAEIVLSAADDGNALLVELLSISAWDMKTTVFNPFIMDKISEAIQKYPSLWIDDDGLLRIDLDKTLEILPLPCELTITGRLTNVSVDKNGIELEIEKNHKKRRLPQKTLAKHKRT
ncbi:MAG: hypothetical protein MJ033_03050 [Victivallaceae bacterium]|nr:hypothetical protein [Victivallaceae bacterium]